VQRARNVRATSIRIFRLCSLRATCAQRARNVDPNLSVSVAPPRRAKFGPPAIGTGTAARHPVFICYGIHGRADDSFVVNYNFCCITRSSPISPSHQGQPPGTTIH
jgi:hypothetical protein